MQVAESTQDAQTNDTMSKIFHNQQWGGHVPVASQSVDQRHAVEKKDMRQAEYTGGDLTEQNATTGTA